MAAGIATSLAGCAEEPACPAWDDAVALGTVDDPAVTEASGLAASQVHPGVFWTHDDDGEEGRLVALDEAGAVLAEVVLPGAAPTDWEDLALARRDGRDGLLVGDIGDNAGTRGELELLWVPEPDPADGDAEVAVVDRVSVTLPGGPVDAEALAVDPATGSALLLSHEAGRVRIFEAPDAGGEATLVADLELVDGALGGLGAVRAADVSPAGDRIYLRGDDGVAWATIEPGASAWEGLEAACSAPSPPEEHGEGLAALDDGFATIGEGAPTTLWRVKEAG